MILTDGATVLTPIERIKIYGERNSGTRFLFDLCRKNFALSVIPQTLPDRAKMAWLYDELRERLESYPRQRGILRAVVVNRMFDLENERRMPELLGWKHMRPPVQYLVSNPASARGVLFLVVVKHPVFWTLSFHRHPYHDFLHGGRLEFSDFIRNMFIPTWRDNVSEPFYPSVIDLYASKIDGYRELQEMGVPFELVRYEDLIRDISGFIRGVSDRHGVDLQRGAPIVPNKSTKPDDRQFSDFQNSYSWDKLESAVSPEDRNYIYSRFGEDRLRWLGYTQHDRSFADAENARTCSGDNS